jgi:hypothetical protein
MVITSIPTSNLANIHEYGTAFLVDSKFNHMVINFTLINERPCVIRIKGRLSHQHTTNDSKEEAKDKFYETPSATRENKQIKSDLTRSVQRLTRKRTPP